MKIVDTPALGGFASILNTIVYPGQHFTQMYTPLRNDLGWTLNMTQHPLMDPIAELRYIAPNNGTVSFDATYPEAQQ